MRKRKILRSAPALMCVALTVVAALVVTVLTSPAYGQVAGLEQFLVVPNTMVFGPAKTPLQIQRMREVPLPGLLLGVPTVKYSFGEFLLLKRETLLSFLPPPGPIVVETPSDEYHADVDPLDLHFNSQQFWHVNYLMTPVKDQGSRGTCHVMAAVALMESLLKKRSFSQGQAVVINGKTRRIIEDIDLSEQWLQYRVKKRAHGGDDSSCGDGGDPLYDLDTVKLYGGVPETFWAYNVQHWAKDGQHNDMLVGAPANGPWNWKVIAQTRTGNAPSSATTCINRRNSDPTDLEDFKVKDLHDGAGQQTGINYIKDQVKNKGLPVVVCVPWPTGRMVANGCVLYVPDEAKNKTAQELWDDKEWSDSQQKNVSKWFRGGHAILLMGVGKPGTPAAGLYAFKNSWTRWYGDDGYGYFTEAFLQKCLGCTRSCKLDSS